MDRLNSVVNPLVREQSGWKALACNDALTTLTREEVIFQDIEPSVLK